jgi:hypothetical protein
VPVTFAGAAPGFGADVMCGALRAGDIRSGADGRALAMLRLDRAFLGGLEAEGVALTLDPPAWLRDRFTPPTPVDTLAVP